MFFLLTLSAAAGLALGNIFEAIGLRAEKSAKTVVKNKIIENIMRKATYYAGVPMCSVTCCGLAIIHRDL